MSVKSQEKFDVLYWGKLYAMPNRDAAKKEEALQSAALLYAVSDTEHQKSLLWWWVEGVRDYAIDEEHIVRMQNQLIYAAEIHTNPRKQ